MSGDRLALEVLAAEIFPHSEACTSSGIPGCQCGAQELRLARYRREQQQREGGDTMTAAKKQDPKELEELEVHGGQQVVGLVDDYIRKAVSQLVVVSGVEQEINRIIGNRLTSIVEEQLEARTQEVAEKILEQELRRRLKHLLEGRLPFTLGVTIKARDSELLAAAVEETKPKPKPKRKRKKKVIRKVTP